MSNITYLLMTPRHENREAIRVQKEREHPDAFSRYEIREQLQAENTNEIRVQTIGSNLRKPLPSAPASRIQSSPVTN